MQHQVAARAIHVLQKLLVAPAMLATRVLRMRLVERVTRVLRRPLVEHVTLAPLRLLVVLAIRVLRSRLVERATRVLQKLHAEPAIPARHRPAAHATRVIHVQRMPAQVRRNVMFPVCGMQLPVAPAIRATRVAQRPRVAPAIHVILARPSLRAALVTRVLRRRLAAHAIHVTLALQRIRVILARHLHAGPVIRAIRVEQARQPIPMTLI